MKTLPSLFFISLLAFTTLQGATTHREKQFENEEVIVWKTTIEPHQPLSMHRHDHKRLAIALNDIDLTVKNDQGKSHPLVMKRGTARFFAPDKLNELHCDLNNKNYPMEVMVVEWKK